MESKDVVLLSLSIPISLAVNLATPRVQRVLSVFNEERKAKQERRASDKLKMWAWLAENPQVFNLYLTRSSLAMIRNILAAIAAGGAFLWLVNVEPQTDSRSGALDSAAMIIYLALILLMVKIQRHTYDLQYAWVKVREINRWPADFYFKPIPENFQEQQSSRRTRRGRRKGDGPVSARPSARGRERDFPSEV